MNGHIAVGALLEKYGDKFAGPTGNLAPGIWNGGRSPIIRSAFRDRTAGRSSTQGQMGPAAATDPGKKLVPGQQEFRERTSWGLHVHELKSDLEDKPNFDLVETTVSHLFRRPAGAGRDDLRTPSDAAIAPAGVVQTKTKSDRGNRRPRRGPQLGQELLPFEKQGINTSRSM